jgi:hypothetical protein
MSLIPSDSEAGQKLAQALHGDTALIALLTNVRTALQGPSLRLSAKTIAAALADCASLTSSLA